MDLKIVNYNDQWKEKYKTALLQTQTIKAQQKKQTSWTATLIALCQFFGSAVMVRVVTVHPSLPESLWSNSTEVNGGFELCKIPCISKHLNAKG